MTATDVTDVTDVAPISHREAAGLAETEYDRLVTVLEAVGPDDWSRPTDCTAWTVRDLAGHVLGSLRAAASLRESLRQQREVRRRLEADGGTAADHMTAIQVENVADLTPAELVSECRSLVTKAAAGRRRTPAPLRRFARFQVEIGSIRERWTLGYLVDVILTRDAWMHRVDLSRAVGADLALDGDHDARIVADVAAEWMRRHGQPVSLTLHGTAGGTFEQGTGGEEVALDAVEFCRILSGRAEGSGLLRTEVPF